MTSHQKRIARIIGYVLLSLVWLGAGQGSINIPIGAAAALYLVYRDESPHDRKMLYIGVVIIGALVAFSRLIGS